MKTSMKILAIVAVLAISLTATSAVFAKGGPGNTGNGGGNVDPGTGVSSLNLEVTLSDYMPTAIATVLQMDADVVSNLLASGETCYTIALSQGYTADQVTALLESARKAAIDLALADSAITVEQAEWLVANRVTMNQNSYGSSTYEYQSQTGSELSDGTCVPVGSAGMNRRGNSR